MSTNRKERSDIPRRLATVSIGVPVAVALLSNKNTSHYLIQALHLLCTIEWIKLTPKRSTGACRGKVQNATDDEQSGASGKESTFLENLMIDFSKSKCCFFFPFLSYAVVRCKHPPLTIILTWSFLKLVGIWESSTDTNTDTSGIVHHCQSGLIFLSLGFFHLLRISSSSFVHILLLLFVVWNCDTGALLFGKMARWTSGRTGQLDPFSVMVPRSLISFLRTVSPGKTITGFCGGIIVGTITAMFLPDLMARVWDINTGLLSDMKIQDLHLVAQEGLLDYEQVIFLKDWSVMGRRAVVGFVLSVAGILGDLVESSVKRGAGAKDSGKLFPGHGGMMDRMDSALISAAVYYNCFMQDDLRS